MALVVLLFLHRRHMRRLRAEDVNDKHKSLDFGMDEVGVQRKGKQGKKGEKLPEMSIQQTEQEIRRGRGMSMDMSTGNPYLLPPGLQNSRESLNSLTRSLSGDDRYRPATTVFVPNDSSYPSSLRADESSSITGSSRRGFAGNESSQDLLRNAHRNSRSMSRSGGPTARNSMEAPLNGPMGNRRMSRHMAPKSLQVQVEEANNRRPDQANPNENPFEAAPHLDTTPASPEPLIAPLESPPPMEDPVTDIRSQPRGLPSNPRPNHEMPKSSSPPTVQVSPFESQEDHMPPQPLQLPVIDAGQAKFDFEANLHVDAPEETHAGQEEPHMEQQYAQDLGYDMRRLTMGLRPLPPDDPSENPEQRANRIRSFYKEYFDENTPTPRHHQSDYEDYNAEFSAYDTPIFDPETGQFVTPTPFAEPIHRRAMTPPPRGPPRFRAGPRGGSDSFARGPGPRAFSTLSARPLPPKAKKKAPPPAPLATLPTPAMLKESFDHLIPTDFAPPQSFKEKLTGAAPDSPLGGFRPYSPSIRPQKTLVSSFDDLAIMPSP